MNDVYTFMRAELVICVLFGMRGLSLKGIPEREYEIWNKVFAGIMRQWVLWVT